MATILHERGRRFLDVEKHTRGASQTHSPSVSWDTTRAAKAIRGLPGVAMVSSNFNEYRRSFLYSIALALNIDVPHIDLGDKGADVAFHLSELWAQPDDPQCTYPGGCRQVELPPRPW